AQALLELYPPAVVARLAGIGEEELQAGVQKRLQEQDYLPGTERDRQLDETLAHLAVKGAMERHAGWLEKVPTPYGISYLQTGKDLTGVKTMIGTGGIFAHSLRADKILSGALFDPAKPESLKPVSPQFFVDRGYLFS